eukprot:3879673-Pleurochrysis_carterae.AAC.1
MPSERREALARKLFGSEGQEPTITTAIPPASENKVAAGGDAAADEGAPSGVHAKTDIESTKETRVAPDEPTKESRLAPDEVKLEEKEDSPAGEAAPSGLSPGEKPAPAPAAQYRI